MKTNVRSLVPACLSLTLPFLAGVPCALAGPPFPEFVDPNPNPGNQFGYSVVALSTGNVVITAPFDDAGGTDAGAVYLFNGATGALISTLRGSSPNDCVGLNGVTAVGNGHFVVASPDWDNGAIVDAGAATWGSGITGVSGVISPANSLVGSTAYDRVCSWPVVVVGNGNYVVSSQNWDNGTIVNAGALTWGNGNTGVIGTISAANSLVGSKANDSIGIDPWNFKVLANGNYLLRSTSWDNGAVINAGAVTFGSGATGVSGPISAANSLIGSKSNDGPGEDLSGSGNFHVLELSNGNYVVGSPNWDNGSVTNAGAATWGSGTTGAVGVISAANSLVGSKTDDRVGGYYSRNMVALNNGNYVVRNYYWDNGAVSNAGAVTWGNGTTGVTGVVSAANSLVGSKANDAVGGHAVIALSNGNYLVSSNFWDNGTVIDAGAVTWGSGTTGVTGAVSAANSLVGSTANDRIGSNQFGNFFFRVLGNGNYLVGSPNWDNGAAVDAGAVTFGNGTIGVSGVVSATNSLVGTSAGDLQEGLLITELSNGSYVARIPFWDNGAATDAGAVAFGNGTTGVSGAISPLNSLVGSSANDRMGNAGVFTLSNGNYVVCSPDWDNGAIANAGLVAWGNGTTGVSGVASAANGLSGPTADDRTGSGGAVALSNGNYVVCTPEWDKGATANAGAVTWRDGDAAMNDVVSAANSLIGSSTDDNVGGAGAVALSNGNYVVCSPGWDNGATANAGAVTWRDGDAAVNDVVSAANSLVGSSSNDNVGANISFQSGCIKVLGNGNYLVRIPTWDNGAAVDAGAVTWGNGNTGVTGAVSAANSLVGSSANDKLGDVSSGGVDSNVLMLAGGNLLVLSRAWDNGALIDAGAASFVSATAGCAGVINAANSARGLTAYAGGYVEYYPIVQDTVNGTFFVRFPSDGGDRVWLGSQADGFTHPDADGDGLLDSWELLYWPTTSGHGPLDDWDHDGYEELLELAFGLAPTISNAGHLPLVTDEGGYLTMTLTKQPGVTYEVQTAGTLLPAQPESFSAASTTILINNATTLKVRDNFLISGSAQRFIRAQVTAAQ